MRDIHDFEPVWEGWEILEPKLGEGAYGSVWKARHIEANQLYFSAIKHISIPQNEAEINALKDEGVLTDADSARSYYQNLLQTLLAEIDVMYSLRGQTHIVSYEDHKVMPKEDGIGYDVFIRMELLDKVHANRLTQADVLKLGKDIAAAIGLMNRLHIVHRDIKPQNILVNRIGDYKLGDYGTAKTLDRKLTSMSIKGTYSYMAPELFRSGKADATVDIYSLGIVLYRLLNGDRLPFYQPNETVTAKKTEEKLMRRISGEPLPPPAMASPSLSRVILKACAFRPEDRYQSGLELLRALEELEKNESQEENSISIFSLTNGEKPENPETEKPDAQQAVREEKGSQNSETGFGEKAKEPSKPMPEWESSAPHKFRKEAEQEAAPDAGVQPKSGKANRWRWRAATALFLVILIALLVLKPWRREDVESVPSASPAIETEETATVVPEAGTEMSEAEDLPAAEVTEPAMDTPAPVTNTLAAVDTPAVEATEPVTDTPMPVTDTLAAAETPTVEATELVTDTPVPATDAPDSTTDTSAQETDTHTATDASSTDADTPAPAEESVLFQVTGEPAAGDTALFGIGVPGSEVSIRTKRVGRDWDDFRTVVVSVDGTWEADFSDQPLEGQEIIRIVYWITDTKTIFETITVSGEAPTPEPDTAYGADMAPVTPFYVPQSWELFLKTIPEVALLEVSFTLRDTELHISAKSDQAVIHVYDHDLELKRMEENPEQSTEALDEFPMEDHLESGETLLHQDLKQTAETNETEYVYALGSHQLSDLTVTVADATGKLLRKYTNIITGGGARSETQTQRFDQSCLLPGTDYAFYMGSDDWTHRYFFSSGLRLIQLGYEDDLSYARIYYYTSAYTSNVYYAFTLWFEDDRMQGSAEFHQYDDTWYWDYEDEKWISEDGTEVREDLTIRGDDSRYLWFLLPVATQEWFDDLPTALIEEENLSRPEVTAADVATDMRESMLVTVEEEEPREDPDLSHFKYTTYTSTAGGVAIVGYSGDLTALIFPAEINGHRVVQIGGSTPVGASLKQVVIPEGVISIGEKTFQDSALEQISLPKSLQKIGEYAFSGSHLQFVTVPAGVSSIPGYCFYNCDHLEMVTLQEGLEEIGERSFVLCSRLRNVNIPASVKSLHSGAFARYTGKLVVNPDNPWLEQRGTCIFQRETGMLLHCKVESGKAVIAEGVRMIGDHAFSAMAVGNQDVETVEFPTTLEEIGEFAFGYCMALSDLRIPGNVRKIGNAAFWNCNGLKEVVIEEGVEEIETDAFGCCYGLTRMILPASLKTIGSNAFSGSYEGDNTSITIVAPADSAAAKYAMEGGYKYEEATETDMQ